MADLGSFIGNKLARFQAQVMGNVGQAAQSFGNMLPSGVIRSDFRRETAKGLLSPVSLLEPQFARNMGPSPRTAHAVAPRPQAAPVANYDRNRVKSDIDRYFKEYGSPPVATLSAQFADLAGQHPILRQYPYLLPSVAIQETSGGRKVKYPNNPINWGIYVKDFKPTNFEMTLQKAAAGIGGDPTSNSAYIYQDFRDSGDLKDFVRHYAPPNENDSAKYLADLQANMARFRGQ